MGSSSLSRNRTRAPLCWELGVSVAGPAGESLPRNSAPEPRAAAPCSSSGLGPRPREALLGLPTRLPSPLLLHFCAFFTAGNSYLLAFLWRVVPTRTAAGLARPAQGHTRASSWHRARAKQVLSKHSAARGMQVAELGTGLPTGCSLLSALIPHSPSSLLSPLFLLLH